MPPKRHHAAATTTAKNDILSKALGSFVTHPPARLSAALLLLFPPLPLPLPLP
jgi:hypothetical protein